MKLTIGIPHCNDYDGLYFTIQDIRKELALNGSYELLEKIEFVVVEDNCDDKQSECVKKLLKHNVTRQSPVRYKALNNSYGPSRVKDCVIREATGDFVLIMDSHVLLCPTLHVIKQLFKFIEDNPNTDHLYSGPLLSDDLVTTHTHFNDVWGGPMWGVWGKAWLCTCGYNLSVTRENDKTVYISLVEQERLTNCPTCSKLFPSVDFNGHEKYLEEMGLSRRGGLLDRPFEIFAQGMGLFLTRRESWLGFNRHAIGFGGEECYIHTKYRQAGRKCICLPFLKWLHRFDRPAGLKYRITTDSRIRNYILGFMELGLDLKPVLDNFKDYPKVKMNALINEAELHYSR